MPDRQVPSSEPGFGPAFLLWVQSRRIFLWKLRQGRGPAGIAGVCPGETENSPTANLAVLRVTPVEHLHPNRRAVCPQKGSKYVDS